MPPFGANYFFDGFLLLLRLRHGIRAFNNGLMIDQDVISSFWLGFVEEEKAGKYFST